MKNNLIVLMASAMALAIVFASTSPNNIGLPVYLGVFSLIYIFCLSVITLVIELAYAKTPKNTRRFIAIVLAFSPTILLAITTLSSLTIIDFLLAVGIPAVIVWYGLKGKFIK